MAAWASVINDAYAASLSTHRFEPRMKS